MNGPKQRYISLFPDIQVNTDIIIINIHWLTSEVFGHSNFFPEMVRFHMSIINFHQMSANRVQSAFLSAFAFKGRDTTYIYINMVCVRLYNEISEQYKLFYFFCCDSVLL